MSCESVLEVGVEGGEALVPAGHGAFPVALVVSDREADELTGGLVVGEVTADTDRLAHDAVEALDLICRVHRSAKRRRKREVGDHALPGVSPGLADLGVAAVPDAGEHLEARLGGFLGRGGVDHPQVLDELLAVLVAGEPERVSDHVDDAGLHDRVGVDGLDRLREALEAVDGEDEDVLDPTGLELADHPQPELGALVDLEPDPQRLLDPVDPDADREVGVLVADRALVADLQHDRVEPDDQVQLLQRAGLPLLDVVEDGVGDAADRVAADLDPVDLLQMLRDLPCRHPARVHRDDLVVEAREPALMLGHDLRLELPLPVTRQLDLDRPVIGDQRLRRRAVTTIRLTLGRLTRELVTEMIGQLRRRRTLDNALGQLLQQPIRARDRLRALTTGEQLIDQLVRNLLRGHDPPLRIMHTQNPGRSRSAAPRRRRRHHPRFRRSAVVGVDRFSNGRKIHLPPVDSKVGPEEGSPTNAVEESAGECDGRPERAAASAELAPELRPGVSCALEDPRCSLAVYGAVATDQCCRSVGGQRQAVAEAAFPDQVRNEPRSLLRPRTAASCERADGDD